MVNTDYNSELVCGTVNRKMQKMLSIHGAPKMEEEKKCNFHTKTTWVIKNHIIPLHHLKS